MAEFPDKRRQQATTWDVDIVTVETYHRPSTPPPDDTLQLPSQPLESSPHGRPLAIRDLALAILLAITAFGCRWPLIERGETLLHPDEAIVGIMAQDIAAGRAHPVYFYGQRYMGALEAYVVAAVSPYVSNPIHALRAAPCLFFSLLVAVQFLMLNRWFGRRGGLIGAVALIAGPPMFAQWSISARGGYIEILLWGSLLLWAYSEWFMNRRRPITGHESPSCPTPMHRFIVGLILGSGFWINPSILFFAAPILLHAGLGILPVAERTRPMARRVLAAIRRRLGSTTLPVAAVLTIACLNVFWSVCVEDGEVRTQLLLGLLPQRVATAALIALLATACLLIARFTATTLHLRNLAARNGLLLLGAVIGAAPAIWYVTQHLLAGAELEPALPLGLRPLWKIGETLIYLTCGLPLLFGADPRPFIAHVTVGRDHDLQALDIFTSALVSFTDHLALASAIACLLLLVFANRKLLHRVLRLRSNCRSPVTLLLLGTATTVALYLLGGCSCSFTTIRYLLPVWAFIPGLLAAVWTSPRFRVAGKLAPAMLCAAWLGGQYAMHETIGAPHPLRAVADELIASHTPAATAEILDAHLLTFMTAQQCRVREFEPFWPRLAHFTQAVSVSDRDSTSYVVNTHEWDRTSDWTDFGYPGPPPPETQRSLWPRLRRALLADHMLLMQRKTLPDGFELLQLAHPIP